MATAGATVLGVFNPLSEIQVADVCKKYPVWLHIEVRCLIGGLIIIDVAN